MHKTGTAVRAIYASCAGTTAHRHNNRIMMKLTWPDGSKTVSKIHRLSFIVHYKTLDVPTVYSFGEQLDISHLCHPKLCINLLHLTLEKHSVNLSRSHCPKLEYAQWRVSQPVYADGGELAYAYKLSKHAGMLYAFSHVLVSVEFCGLASIAFFSGSWPPLAVSHIFDTLSVLFAFWLLLFLRLIPLLLLFRQTLFIEKCCSNLAVLLDWTIRLLTQSG